MRSLYNDEIRVRAAVGGRELTLDPVRTIVVPLEVREVESTIPCGFQSEWGTGGVDGEKLMLTAGAGFGSRWGTIHYAGKSYAFDANQLINAFLNEIVK